MCAFQLHAHWQLGYCSWRWGEWRQALPLYAHRQLGRCRRAGVYEAWLYDCTLTSNTAGTGGGVCYGTLYNCALGDNAANNDGGGAYASTLYNCELMGNRSRFGGGSQYGTLYNCALNGNVSDYGGGACHGVLSNCTLTGNSAAQGGGANNGTLYNCILTGNRATDGGGVYDAGIYNCLLTSNSARVGGGTIFGETLQLHIDRQLSNRRRRWGGSRRSARLPVPFGPNTAPTGNNYYGEGCILTYSCTTPLPPRRGEHHERSAIRKCIGRELPPAIHLPLHQCGGPINNVDDRRDGYGRQPTVLCRWPRGYGRLSSIKG